MTILSGIGSTAARDTISNRFGFSTFAALFHFFGAIIACLGYRRDTKGRRTQISAAYKIARFKTCVQSVPASSILQARCVCNIAFLSDDPPRAVPKALFLRNALKRKKGPRIALQAQVFFIRDKRCLPQLAGIDSIALTNESKIILLYGSVLKENSGCHCTAHRYVFPSMKTASISPSGETAIGSRHGAS